MNYIKNSVKKILIIKQKYKKIKKNVKNNLRRKINGIKKLIINKIFKIF